MHERTIAQHRASETAFRSYIRDAAAGPADDIAKLEDLRARGIITDEEFERAKATVLA